MDLNEPSSQTDGGRGNRNTELPPFPVLLRVPRMDVERGLGAYRSAEASAKSVEIVTSQPDHDVTLPADPVRSWLGTLGIGLVWLVVLAFPAWIYLGPSLMPRSDREDEAVPVVLPADPTPSPVLELVTDPQLLPVDEPASQGAMLEPMIIPIDDGDQP